MIDDERHVRGNFDAHAFGRRAKSIDLRTMENAIQRWRSDMVLPWGPHR